MLSITALLFFLEPKALAEEPANLVKDYFTDSPAFSLSKGVLS